MAERWGIELNGLDSDKSKWRAHLKQPYDPYVEEIKDHGSHYLVLRAESFEGVATSPEVHEKAKQLLKTLNVAMDKIADAGPISEAAVVEFISNGRPRKHVIVEVQGVEARVSVGTVEIIAKDAEGNILEPRPMPSKVQLWAFVANLKPDIRSALDYLEGKPGWVDLYKAYEAVKDLPNGGIPSDEISRFRQTANTNYERHHPKPTMKPHPRPMELWEARALITQWVAASIDDFLAKLPK